MLDGAGGAVAEGETDADGMGSIVGSSLGVGLGRGVLAVEGAGWSSRLIEHPASVPLHTSALAATVSTTLRIRMVRMRSA